VKRNPLQDTSSSDL